jgi:seryl-tRNA synthetase
MLDIRLIRKEKVRLEELLRRKDPTLSLSPVLLLDEKLREKKTEVERLKAERNTTSQTIGELKRDKKDTATLMEEMRVIGETIQRLDHEVAALELEYQDTIARLPNLPLEEIPVSQDPKDNIAIKVVGEKPTFAFPFKNHVELNERLHLFDFKRGAKVTGSGWPIYCGKGAELEWALLQYMLDVQRKNGFMQWMVPHAVRPSSMYGSGQLPKFEKQLFRIKDEDYDLFLIPTSEVALNALHMDEVLEEESLPLAYTSYSPCFRREAGAAGSQERGLIRVHQFNKVEMFAFTTAEEASKMFERMMASAEEILQGLKLHYRNMLLVTGDMSFGAAKTVDIEVYLPGQNRYYEVSSVSNCSDYQARRSNIRVRRKSGELELAHTLNGSGLATSRLMVALLENNQQADGSVIIPEVLHPYMRGTTRLTP